MGYCQIIMIPGTGVIGFLDGEKEREKASPLHALTGAVLGLIRVSHGRRRHTRARERERAHAHAHARTRTHAKCSHRYTETHTHTHTHIHVHRHARTHAGTHTRTHTHSHSHTHHGSMVDLDTPVEKQLDNLQNQGRWLLFIAERSPKAQAVS